MEQILPVVALAFYALAPALAEKGICTTATTYLSDGESQTKAKTPDRFNHLWDDVFIALGYRITSCPGASIRLRVTMRIIQTESAPGRVEVDISGDSGARSAKYRAKFTAAEYTSDENVVLNRLGFGLCKVMETLDPGFMEKFNRTYNGGKKP